MSDEYRAKVFKSGNSVALRLPKALGLTEGDEMRIVREDRASFKIESIDKPKRKIDVSKFAGKAPWLQLIKPEDRESEHSPRVWDDPDWPGVEDKQP
jgi:antitoxin VapB